MFHAICFMTLDSYQHLPQLINPVAFTLGFLAVRWYSLMYLVGFATVWFLLKWRIEKGEVAEKIQNSNLPAGRQGFKVQISEKKGKLENKNCQNNRKLQPQNIILDLLLVAFFAGLAGGRIGYVLFYNWAYFSLHPWQIISPFDFAGGSFVGLYGMSYHGALLGGILGMFLLAKIQKMDFWRWADFIAPALPAGYFFGRIGNFLNGELFGRVTTSKIGMYFPASPSALRYPSQILEACLEGILLFIILWQLRNQEKLEAGSLLAIYVLGYGVVRFMGEFFRQPDPQWGFIFLNLTLGQLLSVALISVGLGLLFFKNRKSAIIKNTIS
jgi:phosphatidylglycerol---prolipoprotein diacylglyceryl transferase